MAIIRGNYIKELRAITIKANFLTLKMNLMLLEIEMKVDHFLMKKVFTKIYKVF